MDPEELKKIREREKIRELKLRKINNGGGHAILGTRRPRASDGVFIRTDLEDESAEVDVWGGERGVEEAQKVPRGKAKDLSSLEATFATDMNTPPTSSLTSPRSSESTAAAITGSEPSGSTRRRRSTRNVINIPVSAKASRSRTKNVKPAPPVEDEMDVEPDEDLAPSSHDPPLDKKGKPRPETYKQAWSISEQHLLEKLLEEIPDGEKNRYVIHITPRSIAINSLY